MTSSRVRKLRGRARRSQVRRIPLGLVALVLATMLCLVLAAPKRVPVASGGCPDPPPPPSGIFGFVDWQVAYPCDSLTSPIVETPAPTPQQLPVLPAGVLLFGMTAGGALV